MKKILVALGVAVAATAALAQSPREDCTPYDPARLVITDNGSQGWTLERHDGAMFATLDNKDDAEAALAVAKRFHAICYIGRNNKRPDHRQFVMTYWK